jgi:hypothetical protein
MIPRPHCCDIIAGYIPETSGSHTEQQRDFLLDRRLKAERDVKDKTFVLYAQDTELMY